MAYNLEQVIFEQFMGIMGYHCNVIGFPFDPKEFSYFPKRTKCLSLLEIIYIPKKCRCQHLRFCTIIDYTNICFENLSTNKWQQYLNGLVVDFLDNIMYEYVLNVPYVSTGNTSTCREQPLWCQLPTRTTQVVRCPCPCPPPKTPNV